MQINDVTCLSVSIWVDIQATVQTARQVERRIDIWTDRWAGTCRDRQNGVRKRSREKEKGT